MKNKRIELILKEVKSTDDVLNIGCTAHDHIQTGVWIHQLICEKARRVVGIDNLLSEEERTYHVVKADAESMSLGEKFDLIVAGELIEHLSKPGAFLERASEHLKEGGRLILTTPNPWDWTRFAMVMLMMPSTPVKDHVSWYDEVMITNLVNRYGFKVEVIEYIPRLPFDTTKGGLSIISERVACFVSRILFWVGLKRIASTNVFVKCSLRKSERQ